MAQTPHVMIVEARFYNDIADMLLDGAKAALEKAGATYEVFTVPGALEIPAAIKMGAAKGFDAYVALGAVIRGETYHFEIVSNESARGLVDLSIQDDLAIGNCILTCETVEQAISRADPAQKNKGGEAVQAALALLQIKGACHG